MSQRYYYHEHLAGYGEMEARGLKTWGEVHGDADSFLQFSSREFLEYILPKLDRTPAARALELGCGTGPLWKTAFVCTWARDRISQFDEGNNRISRVMVLQEE